MEHVHDWSLAWRLCEGMYWMIEANHRGYFGTLGSEYYDAMFDRYAASIAVRAQPEYEEPDYDEPSASEFSWGRKR